MNALQLVQGIVHQQVFIVRSGSGKVDLLDVQALLAAAMLQARFAAGVFDQDAPHGFRRRRKKVGPVFPCLAAVADHPQPGFVHQRRGLERVAGGFPQHAGGGKISQFIIDQRQQLIRRLAFTARNGVENQGDVVHARTLSNPRGFAKRLSGMMPRDFISTDLIFYSHTALSFGAKGVAGLTKPPALLMPVNLNEWQWILLALGAFITGLAKTGVPGLGVLSVAFFANALSARASTGALLPLLLCADLFSVTYYRKHANWSHLWKLFPWVLLGIVAGYFALGRISDAAVQRLIGGILLGMVALNLWRRFRADGLASAVPHTLWFAALTGLVAGFATMVANAAGPVMTLYLLAIGLPKLELIGTGAWFFMLVNAVKVPFSVNLGLITTSSLLVDAVLILPMVPGALLGPIILRRLDQPKFEIIVLLLAVAASLRLMF